jgi:mRNA interferase MazF
VVRRGEVRLYEHPDQKRRPALIMTRDEAIGSLNELFVVLATSTIRNLDTEVELGPEDGMPRACVLNADHTDAAEKIFLTKRITELDAHKRCSPPASSGTGERRGWRANSLAESAKGQRPRAGNSVVLDQDGSS